MKERMELAGKSYLSVKAMAELWGLHPDTVARQCRDEKIAGAVKADGKHWYLPIDSVRPLGTEKIRQLLELSCQLRRDPSLEIDASVFEENPQGVLLAYRQMEERGYVLPFAEKDERKIPRAVELTERGRELLEGRAEKSFSETLKTWVAIIAPITQIALKLFELATS